ncbi:PREDICTED: V-type proton ATPase 116 kDa subunit a-like isoform X2 [Amphimedon queenslandica]|uniref:V-type proton ATPase subunit a n=1 Tax=Amphimedon queenslandica TaxID=400682 RepID=A0AAN0JEP6_AMPQE|nr:PREDICTED: V-type proton ATPase 116 kDa subunit a-like isoform X2 [Amphimedon queenslandica]|eukprot:XP_019855469.1 PREDICTED: V-type proton ATPase 116 kDa subunit a-like isoform X2 [Amphimedon queenslandica]
MAYSLFRSEEMTLAQLFLQSDSAYSCVRELGEIGKVQFRDLNPDVSAFQRKFVNEVRRCDEMDRKLKFLTNELEKANIEPRPAGNIGAPDPQELIDLESKFEVLEAEVKEINTNKETLKRNRLDLIELQQILVKAQIFFQEAEQYSNLRAPPTGFEVGAEERGLLDEGPDPATQGSQTKFMFVAGVIAQERLASFERVLWRACRGNVYMRQAAIEVPLEDPTTGTLVYKVVFVLFFQGDALRTRVRKICEGFRATLYQCPETAPERQDMATAVNNRLIDLDTVLNTTQEHSRTQLQEIAQEIDIWQQKVTKVKAIYHTMNMFNLDMAQHCLVAECWCPVEDLDQIQGALMRGTERSGSTVPSILNRMHTRDSPPTYFKTNKFTKGFQNIVDAYGIASYQEVNPALYTIITFPFLFAVMFGDAGHGLIMALFALSLVIFEKKLEKSVGEMFGTIFHGRYIILLMGLFSIYTGTIYNDIFSKSVNLFGSHWNLSYVSNGDPCCFSTDCTRVYDNEATGVTTVPPEAQIFQDPYPIGLDPIWQVAENKLLFTNSYKMKMSITLGVFQMTFGVILGIFNYVHFKDYISIFSEFIPQMLFLLCIFGWLVVLMFIKWIVAYSPIFTAPSLLITLINMFLQFGQSPVVKDDCTDVTANDPCLSDNQYSVFSSSVEAANGQKFFQIILVIVAVACVPWMLLTKPIYKMIKQKRALKNNYSRHIETGSDSETGDTDTDMVKHHDDDDQPNKQSGDEGEEHTETSELFVHQAIHTIEYCLGTISNTASYLRLWALSLAHAELSEVLWTMVLQIGLRGITGFFILDGIVLVPLFAGWAVLTVGILLVMEGLSAFLHGLRLHWVEFQSKFYAGAGYKFAPFSFEAILSGEEDSG